jgi:hypothetical protein
VFDRRGGIVTRSSSDKAYQADVNKAISQFCGSSHTERLQPNEDFGRIFTFGNLENKVCSNPSANTNTWSQCSVIFGLIVEGCALNVGFMRK